MLFPLGNATSGDMRKRLAGKRFYVGDGGMEDLENIDEDRNSEGLHHVVVGLAPPRELQNGEKYT